MSGAGGLLDCSSLLRFPCSRRLRTMLWLRTVSQRRAHHRRHRKEHEDTPAEPFVIVFQPAHSFPCPTVLFDFMTSGTLAPSPFLAAVNQKR